MASVSPSYITAVCRKIAQKSATLAVGSLPKDSLKSSLPIFRHFCRKITASHLTEQSVWTERSGKCQIGPFDRTVRLMTERSSFRRQYRTRQNGLLLQNGPVNMGRNSDKFSCSVQPRSKIFGLSDRAEPNCPIV
jgi:hypothetical protein